MTSRWQFRLALAAALIIAIAATFVAPASAEEPAERAAETTSLNLETVELGDPALEEARQLILDERWEEAREKLVALRQTQQKHGEAGLTLALQTLVEQETGRDAYARCLWVQARYLHPPLANTEFGALPAYQGVVHPKDPYEIATEPASESDEEREILAPTKIDGPDPRVPANWRHRDDLWGQVMLQASINEEGTVDDIVVLETPSAASALLTLNALCRWTFEPATLDGEPVPVYYNWTVNFRRTGRSR